MRGRGGGGGCGGDGRGWGGAVLKNSKQRPRVTGLKYYAVIHLIIKYCYLGLLWLLASKCYE